MRGTAASRRYARAVFTLAREESRIPEVRAELDELVSAISNNAELHSVLLTPLRPVRERKAVLQGLTQQMQLSPTVRHFVSFLIDRRRLIDFSEVAEEYARLADEASGLTTAEVVSASELDERRKDRLRRALSERTGREVRLEVRVDPSLIGGAIAKVGDLVFDGSLRTQLSQLRGNLMKGS